VSYEYSEYRLTLLLFMFVLPHRFRLCVSHMTRSAFKAQLTPLIPFQKEEDGASEVSLVDRVAR
jgi:hypothetical protein